ncbi:MAG: secretin N-terminal domain-containing protein [Phycisphaerales bacterium]
MEYESDARESIGAASGTSMRARRAAIVAASLIAASGTVVPVWSARAQEATPAVQPAAQPAAQPAPAKEPPAQAPTPAPAQPAAQPTAPAQPPVQPPAQPAAQPVQPPAPKGITFNFKDVPFDFVLDFFSRESGLPIIREVAVPAGNMTFIGASAYAFDDALSILNLNLAMHGVQLRRQDQFLYLSTLQGSAQKAGVVAREKVPPDMKPEQFLTLTLPLSNAAADLVATQIKPMIGPFGAVTSVPAQNMLVIVESAAQCRRIQSIVQTIDDVRPVDTQFKLFKLEHAQADAVYNALRGLIGERVKQTFIDKDGKQTTVQDISISGMNIQPDARTNSIIAVGPVTRLQTCEELVKLLDQPDGGAAGETQMVTFTLRTLTPEDAARKIEGLFASVQPKNKPVLLPLPESGKLTLVGAQSLLLQATALMGEIDPGAGNDAQPRSERRATTVRLKYVTPTQIEAIAGKLLTPRQMQAVKFAPTPDSKGMVATGPDADLKAFEQLVQGIDVAPQTDKEVRLVRITGGDPKAVLDRATQLYSATGKSETDPVAATLDEPTRSVTLIGSRAALTAFDTLLVNAQQNAQVVQESRTFDVAKVRPSVIAPKLSRLARPMLAPTDGSTYHEPSVEPVDELNKLVVRAEPAQMATLAELVKRLDADDPSTRELRVVKLTGADPKGLLARAEQLYAQRSAGLSEDQAGPVTWEFDDKSGSALITARSNAMRMFTDAITQAQQLVPPARTTRVIDVQNVAAKELVPQITELLAGSDPSDPARRVDPPSMRVIERTNSLLVTGEDLQVRVIEDYVKRLDKLDRTDLPPLKLLQLKTADVNSIASMLTQQYGSRAQAERSAKPVDVRADAATNTLIVSAHPDLFNEIKAFVEELNKDKKDTTGRVTQLFPLKVAKATDVASAMEKLYPQPPMPVDRLGRPMPWAQQPKEVTVSADSSSNSLIIDAPQERMESIQALAGQLDRVELPPQSQLRTYRVVGANLGAIVQTLQSLSRQGNLAAPAQPGKQAVQVLIESEPKSSTLIVAGDTVTFERVETMLKELQAVPIEKSLRVFPIANAKAADIKDRAKQIYDAQIAQIPGANPVELNVDETTNSLLVVADTEGMTRFSKVMDELSRQAGPAREIRMIELKLAKAKEVVTFLEELLRSSKSLQIKGGPDPVFEAIDTTNSVLVAAQPAQFSVIEALVKNLDNQKTAERPPMRIMKLRTTDAASMAQILTQAYDKRTPEMKLKQPVDIQPDAATNTLIVSAHADILPEIEAVIEQLNEQQAVDVDGREIRIFPLKVARAEELAKTIDQMYPEPPMPRDPRNGQPRPDLQRTREIVVRADRATNSLIVDAPAKRLAGFEQIVKSLDQTKLAENVEVRSYRVARADLASVVSTLKNLASTGAIYANGQGAPGVATPVTVDSEPTTRTLIVSGPTSVFASVEKVLQQMDGPANRPGTNVKMYTLKHARAERLQSLLERLLTTRLREIQDTEGRPVADVKSLLEVAADAGSNTLIISAPAAIQEVAEQLIQSLDSEAAASGRSVIRVVPLSYAEAGQVAQTLNQAMPTFELPSGGKVTVLAAPGSNAILITGVPQDLAKIEELVKPLDIRPTDQDTPSVETFALKNADAGAIAKTVEALLVEQQQLDPRVLSLQLQLARQARQDLFKKPLIKVEAETRSNSLIVSAPAATIQLAKSVIERLDQPAGPSERTAATYTPSKGDLQQLSTSVLKMVNATVPVGRTALELVPEPKTGSILAIGTPEQVGEALKRLAEMDDRSMLAPAVELAVIDLANADAASVASTVQGMLSDRSRWPEELRRAEKASLNVPQPTVNADSKSNRLLVSAPTVLTPIARELIATLDKPATQSTVDVRVFPLGRASAGDVATALRAGLEASVKPGQPKPTISAEPSSNVVVVSGSSDQLERAAELIKPMDEGQKPDAMGVRTVFLKHARAETVQPVVEQIMKRDSMLTLIPEYQRMQYLTQKGPGTAPGDAGVHVAAERRLNAIVVSGPVSALEVAEQVVSELDADPATRGGETTRAVRLISLLNADAQDLATSIEAVFKEDVSTDQPPTVRVDKASNSLIVRATNEQFATIEELAGKLDKATLSTSRQMRMIPVDRSRVDAELMAQTLRRLLEQQGGVKVQVISTDELLERQQKDGKGGEKPDGDKPKPGPKGGKKPQSMKPADESTSATQIAGVTGVSRDSAGGVTSGPTEGTQGGLPAWAWLVIGAVDSDGAFLGQASPEPPASEKPVADKAAGEQAATKSATPKVAVPATEGPEQDTVTIAVDPSTNSLVILASPRMTDRLAELVGELEKQMPTEPTSVHVVTLPATVDASQIAPMVNSTLQQVGRASTKNPGGFSGPVSVAADPAGASLVVLANDTDFESISRLITSITQVGRAESVSLKVYPLENVTAAKASASLNDLFSAEPRGRQARRMRQLEMTVKTGDGEMTAKLDPSRVRVSASPGGTAIIVAAPAESMGLIDQFVAMIDQSPVTDRLSIRRYPLQNARAQQLSQTIQQLMDAQRQGPNASELPQAHLVADARTNALLVTASESQHSEIKRLLETADASAEEPGMMMAIIPLQQASPATVRRIVEEVLIGRDQAKASKIRISADDSSSLFVVRAQQDDIDEVKKIVAQVDSAETNGLPVRTVKLERADAQQVATALQKFFNERAQVSSRPGQKVVNRVAVVGDVRSGSLVVASSDKDFEQVKSLASAFDTPATSQDMQFRIITLKNARVMDIEPTIRNIADTLRFERSIGQRKSEQSPVLIEPNERTNAIVVVGTNDQLETVEKIIGSLDQPGSERVAMTVKAVMLERADPRAVSQAIERAMVTPGWRSWRGQDPDAVTVQTDAQRRALILVGKAERVELAAKYIAELDNAGAGGGQEIQSITLQHARADRAAESLNRFFNERARAQGLQQSGVSVIGSVDGNVLIVSADPVNAASVKDLVAQIDQPALGQDRRFEMYYMQNAEVSEAAGTLRAMFNRLGRGEEQVVITPQPSSRTLIVSAPGAVFDQVDALVKQLDAPPTVENSKIMTVTLNAAKAADVATALKSALPPNVKVTVTPVARSNSLLLTGSNEAIKLAMDQIQTIDQVPVKSLLAFKRIKLENAMADDVFFTVTQMLRLRPRDTDGRQQTSVDYSRQDNTLAISAPADQIEEIEQMVKQLDVPAAATRKTEFVKLEFANAEQTAKALEVFYGRYAPEAASPAARSVTIVPDPSSNSLVISADEKEWSGIRSLLTKLDSKEYDATQQLSVIGLKHADAAGVARALNEGFRAPLEDQARREQIERQRGRGGQDGRNDDRYFSPTVLVDTQGRPTVSAEPQTNSLIVFAGRRDLDRIESIVKQLDVPGFADLPPARVIPVVGTGKPSAIASTMRELFAMSGAGNMARRGPRSIVIIGDDASSAIIVRADEPEFAQIKALADTLQQQGEIGRAVPGVIKLKYVPAARLRTTLIATFQPLAQSMGEALAIEVERGSNSLVVMCSPRLKAELEKVIAELDIANLATGDNANGQPTRLGQSVFIVDVTNNSPADMVKLLDGMGVTKPQAADRPGVVGDPVTLVPMTTRRAIAVLANPGDGEAVSQLVKALDAEPSESEQKAVVIALKRNTAAAVVSTLRQMLNPSEQQSDTGPARALAEHVRRLAISNNTLQSGETKVDLAKPIRLIPDATTNSVVIASTPGNVAALQDVVKTLDTLPMGEAIVIRMFPLSNASATRIKGVIDELFKQGEAIRRLPGTQRQGLPTTATGQALAGDIAVSVDERTNLLIAAGREEALALVEVLVKDLDSDETSKWIEPSIIQLKHADAVPLSRKLREVLVQGFAATPEAMGIQRQFGRLRMAIAGKGAEGKPPTIEADLFAPLSGLVISPEEYSNSLIVIGTPANAAVVRELVTMFDIEQAAASNAVRVFPLKYAAAERVSNLVQGIFRQREAAETGAPRPEDKLIISADSRTNTLLVSTSQRSLAILESLLKTLDSQEASPSVGVQVIAVNGTDVKLLAPRLERLMRERIEAAIRGGSVRNPTDAFSIEAEPTNNLLIVAASEENVQVVRELLAAIQKDAKLLDDQARSTIIQMARIPAAEMMASLKQLYVDKENAKRGEGSVTVVANDRLNSLLVGGTEEDVKAIRGLVAQFDTAKVQVTRDIERIELKSANALEVVNLLENVLAGRPLGSASGIGARQATKVRFFREQIAQEVNQAGRPPTEAEIDGIIKDQVTLTPELRSNSVVIAAPSSVVALVKEIITDLDTTSAGLRKIEEFQLKNADARQMAELLRDTFNLRQQGNAYVLVPARRAGSDADQPNTDEQAGGALTGTSVTTVPDERQQLSIAIDARTNTIIVSGTEQYMELVRKVVNRLDSIVANERERTVFHLRNAKAKDIEATLQKYFAGESTLEKSTLGPQLSGSVIKQLEEEVTIIGDEKSNKLVISSAPRFTETVLSIVRELDAAPPQVMIQVLLAEVTIDSENNWGADLKIGPFGGDNYTTSLLGAGAGVGTAIGVPNLSVSSADFSLLIRSLQVQGKLEILSNPQLLVSNNQNASIQVGENVAIVQGVERTPQGNTRSDVKRQDVGVIVDVTPTISADGFVRMEIKPEISQVSGKTTQISEDFVAPIIDKRTLDTIVTVKDGQSIVIGGLLQTNDMTRDTKVPGLGDIPLVGSLFRSNDKNNTKTELMVILTPRVIPGQEADWEGRIERMNEQMINRLQDPTRVKEYLNEVKKKVDELQESAPSPESAKDKGVVRVPFARPTQQAQESPR